MPASAGVISNVQVNPFTISPNGDGMSDSTIITYDLADTVGAVHVLILEKDLATVVDSLVKGIPRGVGTFTTSWDGTDSFGATVAEDSFFCSCEDDRSSTGRLAHVEGNS